MVNGALSSQPLLCPGCRNQVGVTLSNGIVVSKHKGRTIRIECGEIACEHCRHLIVVDNRIHAVVR